MARSTVTTTLYDVKNYINMFNTIAQTAMIFMYMKHCVDAESHTPVTWNTGKNTKENKEKKKKAKKGGK